MISIDGAWRSLRSGRELMASLLAGGGLRAVVDVDLGLAGLLGVTSLLGGHVDTTFLVAVNTDSLTTDENCMQEESVSVCLGTK